MSREWFDHDPLTGVTEYLTWDAAQGKVHITYEQDVEPILDHTKELANSGAGDKNFRGECWLYAKIPPIVQMELLKRGINVANPGQIKDVVDAINRDYPWLKTTHKHHALRR